ncbi:MAG: NADH:flavin oxidoreductase / oxidase family, partial [Acidobacteria bacterium]|nr:NADH:flavin oxidoreductase / oxidase family [Acidobacteriota bacterium]
RRNGKDWPLIMLMNAMEVDLKDGLTIQETKQFAKMFEQAGADAIEIRAEYYRWTNNVKRRDSTHFPDVYFYPEHPANLDDCVEGEGDGAGANLPMAAAIKKAVNIPVICMGKLDWNLGEKAIRDGKVDIISMNRRLLADPAVPKKVLEGRLDDITPCTSCMTCFNLGEHFQPVACRVNASLGREREYEIKPAQTKKKVVVIGGGPAGMEAARVAALRGHEVILYDKEPKLGGSLPVASVVKGKDEDLLGLANYFSVQLDKLGVKVNAGVEASPDEIARIKPDVLIIAAGGLHDVPDIPGIKGSNVLTGPELHSKLKSFFKFMSPELIKKLSGTWLPMVGKNVVIIGGRLHGCQTAEFLIKRGRKVTIVDTGTEKEIGDGLIEVFLKPYLLYWLEDHGVQFFTEVKLEGINSEGLEITDKDGTKKTIKADTVITALPLKPNSDLVKSMEGKAKEMYTIGDAKEPHLIFDAIADGARIGHSI